MANNVLLGALPIVEARADYSSSPIDMINLPIDRQTGGGMVSSPIDMITLPIDTQTGGGVNFLPGGPSGGGGDISFKPFDYVPAQRTKEEARAEIEAELRAKGYTDQEIKDKANEMLNETPKTGMSKKNMMLIGVAALVLGYLVLRRK